MFSCFFKTKFKRFSEILLPYLFLILCQLYNPVFSSATRYQKNSSNVGDVLLNIFGGPFAVVSSQNEVSSACQEHSKLYLQALANMTPWAINSKLLFSFSIMHVSLQSVKEPVNYLPGTGSYPYRALLCSNNYFILNSNLIHRMCKLLP